MSESSKDQASTSKAPTPIAYHVRDRKGGDAIWTRIGSAWAHADGKGFNVQIETVPLDGRISLRTSSKKAE
jgi:hypothetical protein